MNLTTFGLGDRFIAAGAGTNKSETERCCEACWMLRQLDCNFINVCQGTRISKTGRVAIIPLERKPHSFHATRSRASDKTQRPLKGLIVEFSTL